MILQDTVKTVEEEMARARQIAIEADRARLAAERIVHMGPRGGLYRIVAGRKRYDVACLVPK